MLHPSTPNTQNPLPRTCRIIHTPVPTILTMTILSARLSAKQQTVKAAKGMRSQLRLNLDDVIPPPPKPWNYRHTSPNTLITMNICVCPTPAP